MSADEIVDVVDEDDKLVRRASRAEIRRQRLRHRSVYILLFNTRGQIFIHRRTVTKDVYGGYWDVAVGGVVAAGETYDACAARELSEEVGVVDEDLSRLFAVRYEDDRNLVNGMVYVCTTDHALRLQAEEIDEGCWVDLDEVPILVQTHRFCPDGLSVLERYRSTLR